jgi:hypothetical protein
MDWDALDSSLTSALIYLMHLPTINHIKLSFIQNFPLSNLISSVNLQRLDIFYMCCVNPFEDDSPPEIVVQSEIPKIREFHTSNSSLLTKKLLHAKKQDGRPAFNFMDLRRLSVHLLVVEDELNLRYLLRSAKSLEKLHLTIEDGQGLVGLHDILSPTAHTLKVLDVTVRIYDDDSTLGGLCKELEAMTGHNMLEALSFEIELVGDEEEDFVGSLIQKMEKILVKPGWSALRQVSFKAPIACCRVSTEDSTKLSEALQSLPNKYLNHLPKLGSVDFNFSAYVVECTN